MSREGGSPKIDLYRSLDALVERYSAQIILTGAPSELEVSRTNCRANSDTLHCCSRQNRYQLNSLYYSLSADFVICGNCGPMHLAAATGTPVVALHGPTNPSQWGPWGDGHTILHVDVPCSPCLNLGFEYGCSALSDGTSPCMHTIQVR